MQAAPENGRQIFERKTNRKKFGLRSFFWIERGQLSDELNMAGISNELLKSFWVSKNFKLLMGLCQNVYIWKTVGK